jgi:AcrR family transcriptional regulator
MGTEQANVRRRGRRAGVRNNEAGKETRERLLDSAERLFADRGLDSVSVRDITEAADANTASIHYHFGSKQDLIAATLERRAGVIGERRAELLDDLEERKRLDLRSVLRALVLPTAELATGSEGGRNYVAFLAALGSHAELMPIVIDLFDPYTDRYLQVLARVTPALPDDVRVLRFAVGKDLINRALGQPNGQIHLWIERQRPGADAFMIDSLLDLLVGMFQGPVTVSQDSVEQGELVSPPPPRTKRPPR